MFRDEYSDWFFAKYYQAGYIVSWFLPGNLRQIAIISERTGRDRPLILSNISGGVIKDGRLLTFEVVGQYRITPKGLNELQAPGR